MKERTSSGLSGMHFGHHKACSQHAALSYFEATMCAIPYQTGYSPTRYRTSVNTMLKKKANKLEANQLRTILLLEADFNHLNKKLGRDLLHHAEHHNMIAPEQFGSRKHHSCIDQVLIKRLYYDSLRFARKNGFLCSNDAKSCYDRIVHSVASLAMQRVGMPLEPIVCMLTTLQQMKHFIRTSHGISSLSYGNKLIDNKPVQGSGQGNGASPTIWTLISTPLLNMMKSLGFGVSLTAPISAANTKFVGCSFVDDTDLLQTSTNPTDTLHQQHHTMQQAIDTWSEGLRTTGGALVPQKCWIHPIEFGFSPKGHPTYKSTQSLQLQFTVQDSSQVAHPLTQIEPNIAKETLGVFLAPDGNETEQINYFKRKISTWVTKVRTRHISKHHAMLAINSTIYKTLEYATPALTITKKQWTSILAPLAKCNLQSIGVCSTFPKVLREGSTQHMGLNLKCMYKTQEIQKVEKYLLFRNHKGLVGQMLRLNEESLLLELGVSGSLYDADFTSLHHLATPSWIKTLWQFLSTYLIRIPMASTPLTPTKQHDFFLIEEFLKAGYTHSKLVALNTCRKYLQVVTLGDITTANGTIILPNIKAGLQHTTSQSTYTWPNQPNPNPAYWKIWRSALRKVFESHGRVLPHYLRNTWSENPARTFHWYYFPAQNVLLHRLPPSQWQLYRPIIRRGRRPTYRSFYRTHTILNSLPASTTPAPIVSTAPHIVRLLGTSLHRDQPHPPQFTQFLTFFQHTFPSQTWALQNIRGLENLPHIVTSIQQGNCALISDGSYHPTPPRASSAWYVGNEALHRLVCGTTPCTGDKSIHSAYRGELAGIYGGLMFIKSLCDYANLEHGHLIVGCDNLGVINTLQSPPHSLSVSHFDYISSILNLLQDIPLQKSLIHVKGHLDRTMSYDHLSIVEKLNIKADTLAQEANRTIPQTTDHTTLPLYKEYGPIHVSTPSGIKKITSSLKNSLYATLTETPTRQYWNKKLDIPPSHTAAIAWKELSSAFTSLPVKKQIETIKWNSEFCGTNKNLFRWKEQQHSKCPTCGAENETTHHILQCPHPLSKQQWESSLNNLNVWLKNQHTAPDIITVIIENLRSWHDNRPPVIYDGPIPHLETARSTQNIIGWTAFLRGFVSSSWELPQHQHYQNLSSKKSAKRWLTELIKKLWKISWDQWRFRNGITHSQSPSSHTNFTFLLTSTIIKESQHGGHLLPPSCSYLFQTHFSDLLKGTLNSKKMWVATVWSARDLYSPADVICQSRNTVVAAFVDSWKRKLRRT